MMDDHKIIELYLNRRESAIEETDKKYGRYCRYIASNILSDKEDSEECVNDTYLSAWNSIPPHRPGRLGPFLGKITRNISLNRWKALHAQKRSGSQVSLALEELGECVPSPHSEEQLLDKLAMTAVLNRFLGSLGEEARKIFMRRYFYMSTVKEIAQAYSLTESKVKMSLMRSRGELKRLLEKEGVAV